VALDRTRIPASTLRGLGHWVVQALGLAALAALRLAGVATALALWAARKVVRRKTTAASATGRNTDVTTAGAARTTLELGALAVFAFDGLRSACRALSHWVLVAFLEQPLVAARAARTSASVAAALAALLARKIISEGVLAADIALGLANVSTALTVAAREEKAFFVAAHGHAKRFEPLAQIQSRLRCMQCEE